MKHNIIYLLIALIVLSVLGTASDYIVDDNMDLYGNDIYNATNVNSTNFDGDLQSEDVKTPPNACSSGYAMTEFVLNFSTVTCSQFLTVADNTTLVTYVDAQDVAYNTTMTTYADAQDDKQLSLSGGTMTGNTSMGTDIVIKLGDSDEACIKYNGSALIMSTVVSDCA